MQCHEGTLVKPHTQPHAIFPVLPSEKHTVFITAENSYDWPITFADNESENVLECSSYDLIAKKIFLGKLIEEPDREMVWQSVQNALSHKQPYQLIYHIQTPQRTEKIVFEQGHGIYTPDNDFIEIQGFISDITDLFESQQQGTVEKYFQIFSTEIKNIIEKKHKEIITKNILSKREIEIYVYFCQGMTMKEIGMTLRISPRTVETHLNALKRKLFCYTSSELRKLFFTTTVGRKLISLM